MPDPMSKKHPDPTIRRLAMGEGTAGRFVDPGDLEHPALEGRRKHGERKRQALKGFNARTQPEHVKATEELLEKQILEGDHPLAVDPLTRLTVREWFQDGASVVEIAKQTGLSLTLTKRVLAMKEKLLSKREREDYLARKFLEAAELFSRITSHMTDEKMDRASFSQLTLGMGISMDKMLMIRKSLDGDAPTQVEMALNVTHDRKELRERIQSLLDQNPRLRALMNAEVAEGVEVTTTGETVPSPKPLPQLQLFEDQESKLVEETSG